MNDEDIILINESSKEDSFSSSVHGSNTITYDNNVNIMDMYQIPDRYYKDRVTLMGVNTDTYYIYWELTPDLISSIHDQRDEFFTYRILNDRNELLDEFHSDAQVGENYLNQNYENMNIHVQLGYFNTLHDFKTLLVSNTLHTFSSTLKFPKEDGLVWIKRERGWTEVIRSTLTHITLGVSSAQYVEEIERLKEFSKESISSISSTEFTKGDK